ncbi:MAG: secondary thiamine-phosphate synthase enzyme YjbQ [bacterium]|nr:secondary thiamine-phosphate synthase enzyme YjbQ [bacterium]
MTIINEKFTIHTEGNTDIIDITKHVQNCVYQHELKDGLVCVSIQGSTSAVTTIEYENGLIQDLQEALERVAPSGQEYHHDEIWHDGNGYAHIRSALLGNSVCIALIDGLLNLGTWQQIVFLDFDNKPRSRSITVQIIN